MAYDKTIWVDDDTPISATNMNKIETALESDDTRLTTLEASEFVAGTYIGDGTSIRTISLGFTPIAVLVVKNDGGVRYYNDMHYGGLAVTGSPAMTDVGAKIVEIVTNGFTVHYDVTLETFSNSSVGGAKYNYIAIKG